MSASSRKSVIHDLKGWRYLVLWPLGMAVRAWTLSLKIELSPLTQHRLGDINEPVVFALWHNRLFIAAEMFRRHHRQRGVYGLVSTSRDGAWLEAFFDLVGIRSVRGSSHRRGREAALGLIEVLKAGHDIGITPDGPRGPLYEFKSGGLVVARRAQAPMVLLGSAYESAWQLPSWDRFYVPLPFSRVRVAYDVVTSAELADEQFDVASLQTKLRALSPDGPMPTSKPAVI
ncbi:MAG: lysophospholipid acyltransferase family protein [Verrucomicrobia bacterium]|nr:lysophospholipid acyltransferase family protein [Verrucomicrobiota bacterium]